MVSLKKKRSNQKRVLAQRSSVKAPVKAPVKKREAADYLPLDGAPGKKIAKVEVPAEKNTSTVLYIGRIPHGFYEDEMRGYFSQFGTIKRLRIARSKKTGNSKHFGFLEFENPGVAEVVVDAMNNYVMFEHSLKVHLIPPEKVRENMWKGVRPGFKPEILKANYRKEHNREKTSEEHQRMVDSILRKDSKRRRKIQAAGIDYDCPDLVGVIQPRPKKIRFNDDED